MFIDRRGAAGHLRVAVVAEEQHAHLAFPLEINAPHYVFKRLERRLELLGSEEVKHRIAHRQVGQKYGLIALLPVAVAQTAEVGVVALPRHQIRKGLGPAWRVVIEPPDVRDAIAAQRYPPATAEAVLRAVEIEMFIAGHWRRVQDVGQRRLAVGWIGAHYRSRPVELAEMPAVPHSLHHLERHAIQTNHQPPFRRRLETGAIEDLFAFRRPEFIVNAIAIVVVRPPHTERHESKIIDLPLVPGI